MSTCGICCLCPPSAVVSFCDKKWFQPGLCAQTHFVALTFYTSCNSNTYLFAYLFLFLSLLVFVVAAVLLGLVLVWRWYYSCFTYNVYCELWELWTVDFCIDVGSFAEYFVLLLFVKAKLMPSDDITVFYRTAGNLERIIPAYYDFIFATIKQPLHAFTGSPPSDPGISVILSDSAKVIIPRFCCSVHYSRSFLRIM